MNQLCRKLLYAVVMAVLIAVAALCLGWASGSPEPDSWRRLLGLDSLWLSWDKAEAGSEGPARLVFRGIYAYLLDLGLPYYRLGWVVLSSSMLAFVLLARWIQVSVADRLGPMTSAVLLLVLCAAMFSPVYGANWLLVERFRIFIPLACLAAGGLLLRPGRYLVWRYLAAMLLAQAALLTDVRGLWVWVALLPCCAAITSGQRRMSCLALWGIAGNVGALACEFSFGPAGPSEGSWIIGSLATDSGAYFTDLITTLGRSLSDIWSGESRCQLVIGWTFLVLLLITSVMAWRRLDAAVAAWWALAIFGFGCALTSSAQAYGLDIDLVDRREIEWSILALPIGISGLMAELVGRRFARWLDFALVSLLVLLVFDWRQGFEDLGWRRAQLREFESRLAFYEVSELSSDQVGLSPFHKGYQLRRAQNKKLIGRNQPVEELSEKLKDAAMESSIVSDGEIRSADGRRIAGIAVSTAEMVWLVRQSEDKSWKLMRAIPITLSQEPDTYAWSVTIDADEMPSDGTALAVFAFDLDTQLFVRLAGAVRVQGEVFQKEQWK